MQWITFVFSVIWMMSNDRVSPVSRDAKRSAFLVGKEQSLRFASRLTIWVRFTILNARVTFRDILLEGYGHL